MGEGDLSDLKELRELVEFLKASGIAEFDMERPEFKVRLKFAGAEPGAAAASGGGLDLASLARLLNAGGGTVAAVPVTPTAGEAESAMAATAAGVAAATVSPEPVDENAGLHVVRSPLVGTFYDAPSPGADSFVKVGDMVGTGKVLCIVEAMKIMNEIESDAAGEIAKMFVKPGQPVEYGQALFGVRV